MIPYTDVEQERIAQAAAKPQDRSSFNASLQADGARDTRRTSEPHEPVTDDEVRGETPEVLQLLVDIESESKFVSLIRSIQRRLFRL